MKLSFTAISFAFREFEIVARLRLEEQDWDKVFEQVETEDLFQLASRATTIRRFREIRQRVGSLSIETLQVFVESGSDIKKAIAFLAICKTYPFIFDFVRFVLKEKLKIFDRQLTDMDFNTYWNEKANEHPELDDLQETTRKKTKQVLLQILAEAGLLSDTTSLWITPYIPIPGVLALFEREGSQFRDAYLSATCC